MIIMGVDSALGQAGIAIINDKREVLYTLNLKTSNKDTLQYRLADLYLKAIELIQDYKVDVMVIEDNFFAKNAATVKRLANAFAAFLLAAEINRIPTVVYAPASHKAVTVRNSKATKEQTEQCVRNIFAFTGKLTDNEADALSLANCYLVKEVEKKKKEDDVE
ncbi:crossover junction endodeoxyribonuclease RuvC [Brevibacillus brevis]|uniref:crossover junction endodeoxyribonuclease RuvC n=1 Tax=Brevibacillus brevis TaxID=1393 RepID=UPI000D0EC158|nr:crossover junction endodeoxyribonuclease RuvC [Brevibacillus brevis]PSJ67464.1 hypothetical protein C7J99_20955 [Brevibacillus brevis]RED28451.1 Holliday junction endonuclease RuvC [Brevibacillus brevis]GEC90706.1 crossover junction endodeoxyribonuclease RuvC [Brevibacillus brevis]VEF91146.1 Crossover junction endodeoxyribonuclease RuvC [Brevibacillus brevis]